LRPAPDGISIGDSDMAKCHLRGRTFISTILLFGLLPIYSLNAVCEVKCRTSAISGSKPTSYSDSRSAPRTLAHNLHEHHSHISQSVVTVDAPLAVGAMSKVLSHRCCDTNQSLSLVCCTIKNSNPLLQPIKHYAFENHPAALPAGPAIHSPLRATLVALEAPRAIFFDATPPLTLRI
jgi:hypothetical protein